MFLTNIQEKDASLKKHALSSKEISATLTSEVGS